jgi:hypothetical protein
MDPLGNNGGRTPSEDLQTGVVHYILIQLFFETGDQSASSTQTKTDEARQRKRKREKARNAKMTQEERNEKNKKRHETYHLKKAISTLTPGTFLCYFHK